MAAFRAFRSPKVTVRLADVSQSRYDLALTDEARLGSRARTPSATTASAYSAICYVAQPCFAGTPPPQACRGRGFYAGLEREVSRETG